MRYLNPMEFQRQAQLATLFNETGSSSCYLRDGVKSPHRAGHPKQNGFVESFNNRMRDELLNEALFFAIGQARSIVARWVDDYNTQRPHSSLGNAAPAAFVAGFE